MRADEFKVANVVLPRFFQEARDPWTTDLQAFRQAGSYVFAEPETTSVVRAAPVAVRAQQAWEDLAFGALALSGMAGIVSALVSAVV